jgi:hypothetical protein
MRKLLLGFLFGFLVLFFTYTDIYGQKVAIHDLGKLLVKYQDDGWNDLEFYGGLPSFTYPSGFYQRELLQMWEIMFIAKEWKNLQGVTENMAYWGPSKNHPGFAKGLSIITYKRATPPTIIVNRMNITQPFIGKVDPSIKSDVYAEWIFKTLDVIGLQSRHQAWTYVNQNHDDYILIRQDIKFTGDIDDDPDQDVPNQTIELAWYDGFCPDICQEAAANLPDRTDWGSGHTWVDWNSYYNYMDQNKWPLLVKNRDRKDLLISYSYNDDDINFKAPKGYNESQVKKYYDDTGVPDPKTGMFLAPTYTGMAIFHADKSASNTSDDINEPKSLAWQTHDDFWGKIWRGGMWDFITNPDNRPPARWKFEGFPHNEISGSNMFMIQGLGPYTLSIGDDFTTVYAIGAGSIDEDLCWTEGQKWYNWYWDLPGDKLDDAGKNALIATGQDSLFLNLNRAYWTFNRNMDIPDPLPAPDIDVAGGPDQIEIKWSYPNTNMFKDPDTGVEDFYKWRLYRKKGAFEVDAITDIGAYNKYELIGTFDKSTTSYIDKTAERGVKYHYCVTALDDGTQNKTGLFPGQKLESSYYANRTKIDAIAFKSGLNSSEQVVIVPNPYSVSTGFENMLNWPGAPNEIRFMNLPGYCTLKIYTATGDLIKTIPHVTGSGDEAWVNLRTDGNQYPASGVYILVVDEVKDLNNNPLPKKMYKFVIVR